MSQLPKWPNDNFKTSRFFKKTTIGTNKTNLPISVRLQIINNHKHPRNREQQQYFDIPSHHSLIVENKKKTSRAQCSLKEHEFPHGLGTTPAAPDARAHTKERRHLDAHVFARTWVLVRESLLPRHFRGRGTRMATVPRADCYWVPSSC